MQNFFVGVDEVDKTLDAARTGEVVFFARAFIKQANAHTVVQKTQLAQTLGQDFIMKVVVLREDVGVGQEVNFGAAFFRAAHDAHGRDFHAIDHLDQSVLHKAAGKFNLMHFALAAHRQAQHLAQCVDAADTHPMQTA